MLNKGQVGQELPGNSGFLSLKRTEYGTDESCPHSISVPPIAVFLLLYGCVTEMFIET
jgi:hypothetical protein